MQHVTHSKHSTVRYYWYRVLYVNVSNNINNTKCYFTLYNCMHSETQHDILSISM